MRIAVDARSLTTQPTGVGQYLMAAVNVWSQRVPQHDFLLLAHKPLHPGADAALVRTDRVSFHCCPAPLLRGNGLWWLTTHFELVARRLGADLLWGASGLLPPMRLQLPALLTVHDLVYRSLPWTMSARSRIAWRLLAGRSIRQAEWLWAVSQFTAGEVERSYPQRRAVGLVVGSGLNPLRTGQMVDSGRLAQVRHKYRVGEKSLLFVGTLEPRKNLGFLLSLMPALAAQGYRLIVVGCAGWGRSGLAGMVQDADFPRDAVLFCDYVTDADLQALYQVVALFVSTSLMEGFGLPHLEAMAAGCPVVAAANSAVVEVVGKGGRLVSGWAEQDWMTAIASAVRDRAALSCMAKLQAASHDIGRPCLAADLALHSGAPAPRS